MYRKERTRSFHRKPTPTPPKTDRKPRLVKMYRKPLQDNFLVQDPEESSESTHKAAKTSATKPSHKTADEITNIPNPTPIPASSTFSPLPPLLTQPPSKTATLFPAQTSLLPSHTQGPKLPVVAIAILAVGSAMVLVGVFIAIKACLRPTVVDRDFDVKEKDSPLFGGKERFSSQTGGLWAWANQPQSNPFVEPMQPAAHTKNTHPDDTIPQYNFPTSQSTWQTIPSYDSQSHLLSSNPSLPVSHQPPRNQNALARAVNRFSVASLSLYPTSPISAQDIELLSVAKRSQRMDIHFKQDIKAALRRSKSEDDKMELAYDGASVTSPKVVQSPVVSATSVAGGRTRIKSSYYTQDTADEPYDVFPFPPMPKSDSRREHDKTQTSALGLTSPSIDKLRIPPSPQPTLYPDDSLSVQADASRKAKSTDESGHVLPAASLDTGTALGSLISLATLAGKLGENISTYGEPAATSGSSATLASANQGKGAGQPPRVPSPPPLPSLTQMGLEHSNPVGFADYRSPTYSICGLYEDERKSRTSYYP
ncbi:hypothetical protein BDZ89DRAFT_1056352 [Hymenopellis radicata]|nr:hypothetical protein BDZ89DRAFT_1056352 [Hymenopellis radicata]